jgi:hypothetical protein
MTYTESPQNAQDAAKNSQSANNDVESTVERLRQEHPSMFDEEGAVNQDPNEQWAKDSEAANQTEVSPENNEEQPPQQEEKQEEESPKSEEGLPSMEELDLPEDLGVDTSEKQDVPELPDTEEAKKFAEQFQQYLGISVDEFRNAAQDYRKTIEYVNQVRAEQDRKQAMSELSQEWGVDDNEVQQRLERVQERFNKYPEEMRQRLDNLEGAKLIWAKIQSEESAKQQQQQQVPEFQRSKTAGQAPKAGQQPRFTKEQIAKMTPAEYEANNEEIIEAYRLGLVR